MRTCLLLLAFLTPISAAAQTGFAQEGIRLFLDCKGECDQEFIRSEITLVDFVRDRTEADVHLLITFEGTGSGGIVHTLNFIGRRSFASIADTLTFTSNGTDTQDERRRGLTDVIEMGLVRYLSRTGLAKAIDLRLVRPTLETSDVQESIGVDPWNYWVFSVGGNGTYNAEESSDRLDLGANISANRTTEEWKIRLSANGNRTRHTFDAISYTSRTRRGSLFGQVVKSLNSHWSAGGFVYANTSTQNNTKFSVTGGPQIEYNIFPYAESTTREFRINYGVRLDYRTYDEVTIFQLEREKLVRHSLVSQIDARQPWGSLGLKAELSHMLTNFERSLSDYYRLELNAGTEVKIVRGLSAWFSGSYNLIRDQLFLPLSGASEEEILLGSLSLPTGYSFRMHMGLNYRFGSIFNNVVNPRLEF